MKNTLRVIMPCSSLCLRSIVCCMIIGCFSPSESYLWVGRFKVSCSLGGQLCPGSEVHEVFRCRDSRLPLEGNSGQQQQAPWFLSLLKNSDQATLISMHRTPSLWVCQMCSALGRSNVSPQGEILLELYQYILTYVYYRNLWIVNSLIYLNFQGMLIFLTLFPF